jgi:threonine dehydrogenase-like Zn-dependent dehydrogenase
MSDVRGLLFPGDRRVIMTDFPDPEPGPGEVVVALRAAAICGSDLHGYRATARARQASGAAGIIPGHEPSGVVRAVGPGVTNVVPGDRVAIYHFRGCGFCPECRGGRLMWCPDRRGYGGPIHGSNADLLLTDARNCLPLPDEVSFTTGALLMCVGGTAYAALGKLGVTPRETLAIFGLGPVGLTGLILARALGVPTIGIDRSPERLALASQLGAAAVVDAANEDVGAAIRRWTGRDGVNAAFETSGNPVGQASAIAATGRGGRVAFVGFGAQEPAINPSTFIEKQLTLLGSFVFTLDTYAPMLRFVREHNVPLEALVTHRLPLAAAADIFPACDRGETGKVVFTWGDNANVA